MKLIPTAIPGVVVIEPQVFADDRSWFMESFDEQRFHAGLRVLGLAPPRPLAAGKAGAGGARRGL